MRLGYAAEIDDDAAAAEFAHRPVSVTGACTRTAVE